MKRIYVVGTADTKGEELAFLADTIAATGATVTRVDVGTRGAVVPVDIAAREVAAHHPQGTSAVLVTNDRGAAVTAMGEAFAGFIESRDDICRRHWHRRRRRHLDHHSRHAAAAAGCAENHGVNAGVG